MVGLNYFKKNIMKSRKKLGRRFYKEESVDVEIEFGVEDILEYIEDYATDVELKEISDSLGGSNVINDYIENNSEKGTLLGEMKMELLARAFKKFSLEELEAKLGSKFDLM